MKYLNLLKNLSKKKKIIFSIIAVIFIFGIIFAIYQASFKADTLNTNIITNYATVTYKDAQGQIHTEQSNTIQVVKEVVSTPPPQPPSPPATPTPVPPTPPAPTPTPQPISEPAVKITITKFHYNARGYYDKYNLNDEYVVIKNIGETVNTSGWKIKNIKNNVFTLGDYNFKHDSKITIYSGKKPKPRCTWKWKKVPNQRGWKSWHRVKNCPSIPANRFYLGKINEMWNNKHDNLQIYKNNTVLIGRIY